MGFLVSGNQKQELPNVFHCFLVRHIRFILS